MADFNIFGSAPEYLTGLLGQKGVEDLQKKALTTGLINAAIGYIAQPKNQRLGGALPYVGRALQAGMTGAQGVYSGALSDWETKQKIEQLKAQQEAVAKVSEQNPQLGSVLKAYPSAAPGVLEKLYAPKTPESIFGKVNPLEATPESLAEYQATGDVTKLRKSGEAKGPTYTDMYKNLAITKFGTDNPNELSPAQRTELDAEVRKRNLERPPQTVIMNQRQVFQDEQELRKEYSAIPEVKLFGEVQNSFDTIKTSLSKQSPAGDLAGATKFMKLLDPGSVVRESELGLAMAATGALDRAQNYYNMLKTGQKLNPAQRADFLDLSTQLYNAAEARKTSYDQQYGSIAQQNQLNPTNVVKGFKSQGEWTIKEKK